VLVYEVGKLVGRFNDPTV